jgi:PAS domain S-box-containing protein
VQERTRELEQAKYKVAQEYEDKIRTAEALKKSETLLQKIMEHMPVGVWIVDNSGKIISGNRASQEIWCGARYVDIEQYGEYKGWWVETGKLIKPHEWGAARAITKGETSLNEEIEIECFDGTHKFILNSAAPLINEEGNVTGAIVVNQDITKLKQAEGAVHESEALYHQFFQSSVAGTFRTLYNPSTGEARRIDCNEAHARILGYDRREDALGHDLKDIFLSDHEFKNYFHELLEKKILRNYRLSLQQKDGKRIWVLLNASTRTYNDDLIMIEGTMVDISDLMQAEKNLKDINEQLGLLTTELIMTEERERRKISIDIHDNIGQTLALTKIKLESLKHLDSKYEFTIILDQIEELVNQSIQQARSLMTELSPSILYELGFTQAIDWLGERMEADYGLQVIVNDDLKKLTIDEEIQVFLFRAVRELLLNVVKHAGARKAYVALQTVGKNIQITIKDKGIGFDIFNTAETTKGTPRFGLLSIKERIKHIGGLLEIRSSKEYGTSVTLVAPRKNPKKRR